MTKTILTLSTALVIAAGMFASAAEAGSCGGGGGYRSYGHSGSYRSSSSASYAKRASKPKAVASSQIKSGKIAESPVRAAASEAVAAIGTTAAEKATPVAEPAIAALDAAVEPAEETSDARSIGCKRFIPAAGLTISVACE